MKDAVTCRDGVRVLMDYTEGLLPPTLRNEVEAHVGICRLCQGFVRSYRETPGIMRDATARRMPAPLGRRLRRLVAALPGRPGRRPRRQGARPV